MRRLARERHADVGGHRRAARLRDEGGEEVPPDGRLLRPAEHALGLAVELGDGAPGGEDDDDAARRLHHRAIALLALARLAVRGGERPGLQELPPAAPLEHGADHDRDDPHRDEERELVVKEQSGGPACAAAG